jgi:hypothetical protein
VVPSVSPVMCSSAVVVVVMLAGGRGGEEAAVGLVKGGAGGVGARYVGTGASVVALMDTY